MQQCRWIQPHRSGPSEMKKRVTSCLPLATAHLFWYFDFKKWSCRMSWSSVLMIRRTVVSASIHAALVLHDHACWRRQTPRNSWNAIVSLGLLPSGQWIVPVWNPVWRWQPLPGFHLHPLCTAFRRIPDVFWCAHLNWFSCRIWLRGDAFREVPNFQVEEFLAVKLSIVGVNGTCEHFRLHYSIIYKTENERT